MGAEEIYKFMIGETSVRLAAAQNFIDRYNSENGAGYLESAALQVRKALESIAFAAIAPNESAYRSLRAQAEESKDFTRDYHAKRIFRDLEKVHRDFYPVALLPAINQTPERQTERHWHFDLKDGGYLTRKRFANVYDKLGKHLHAHNPWDKTDPLLGLASLLGSTINEAISLIELHAAFIRTKEFTGVWIVEIARGSMVPKVISAHSDGAFIVGKADRKRR